MNDFVIPGSILEKLKKEVFVENTLLALMKNMDAYDALGLYYALLCNVDKEIIDMLCAYLFERLGEEAFNEGFQKINTFYTNLTFGG